MLPTDEVMVAVLSPDHRALILTEFTKDQNELKTAIGSLRGSPSKNEQLSQDRAESVRSYLVSKGLPADKTKAVGLGSARPVAENDTADGRANNRRVEIVVEPLK